MATPARRADTRIYPNKEMKAIDMAELIRATLIGDGVIQGCRLSKEQDDSMLMMTPGRVVIGGRLAIFEPHADDQTNYPGDTATKINIPFPDDSASSNFQRYICVVYDPTQSGNADKAYIKLLTATEINALETQQNGPFNPTGHNSWDFNVDSMARIIQLGYVEINYRTMKIVTLDTTRASTGHTNSYPIIWNQRYVDNEIAKFKSREDIRLTWLRQVNVSQDLTQHKSTWFKTHVLVIDGLSLEKTATTILKLSKEYGSRVIFQPDTGAASIPENVPYTLITKKGAYVKSGYKPTGGSEQSWSNPRTAAEYYDKVSGDDYPQNLKNVNTVELHRGIVGVRIINATDGGSGSANCIVQSFGADPQGFPGSTNIPKTIDWRGFMYVAIRNLGSSIAKVRVEITSLYVTNTAFNYPAST